MDRRDSKVASYVANHESRSESYPLPSRLHHRLVLSRIQDKVVQLSGLGYLYRDVSEVSETFKRSRIALELWREWT